MAVYIIFKNTLTFDGMSNKDIVCVKKRYRNAILKCVKKNFEIIEKVFPFYDEEDQYGNNLYFRETPKGLFLNTFGHLDWYDHKSLQNFQQLNAYDVKALNKMLNIQNQLIYPDYNGDFKETFFTVETWKIQNY